MSPTKPKAKTTGGKNTTTDSLIADLLDEAKKVSQEVDKMSKESITAMDDLGTKADSSATTIDQLADDLDGLEKEAIDELDKLAIEQAEDLTGE